MKSSDYKIDNSGKTLVTDELQNLFDKASNSGETLFICKGKYLISPLFIKSNTHVVFESGTYFIGTTDESKYFDIETRVAGIDANWYPALINVIDATNVILEGELVVDGNGPYWWNKYWGNDQKGGMRKVYDKEGLRFACDYDCKRPRNILISSSSNIILRNLISYHSGFWNVHILYSHNVLVDAVKIDSKENSPSTDGIDIDSSYEVEVKNCLVCCNDDSICVKSGRDMDGIRKNIPSHDIRIHDNKLLAGFGITLGSEVSGGIYDIEIDHNEFINTSCGFRIKSSLPRKGYIKNIKVHDLKMTNVKYNFLLHLNWNPNYSICKLPEGYNGEIKEIWKKLLEVPSENYKNTQVENIDIYNIESTFTKDYDGISRVFYLVGFDDAKMVNISLKNANIEAKEFGKIINADLIINISKIDTQIEYDKSNDEFDNR